MRQELKYSIPIVVLLALIVAIASDYCRPISLPDKVATITIPLPFNPLCYVASFKPEAPELLTTYNLNEILQSPIAVTVSGTANPTLSGYRI